MLPCPANSGIGGQADFDGRRYRLSQAETLESLKLGESAVEVRWPRKIGQTFKVYSTD